MHKKLFMSNEIVFLVSKMEKGLLNIEMKECQQLNLYISINHHEKLIEYRKYTNFYCQKIRISQQIFLSILLLIDLFRSH